jgi:hypothetical protein
MGERETTEPPLHYVTVWVCEDHHVICREAGDLRFILDSVKVAAQHARTEQETLRLLQDLHILHEFCHLHVVLESQPPSESMSCHPLPLADVPTKDVSDMLQELSTHIRGWKPFHEGVRDFEGRYGQEVLQSYLLRTWSESARHLGAHARKWNPTKHRPCDLLGRIPQDRLELRDSMFTLHGFFCSSRQKPQPSDKPHPALKANARNDVMHYDSDGFLNITGLTLRGCGEFKPYFPIRRGLRIRFTEGRRHIHVLSVLLSFPDAHRQAPSRIHGRGANAAAAAHCLAVAASSLGLSIVVPDGISASACAFAATAFASAAATLAGTGNVQSPHIGRVNIRVRYRRDHPGKRKKNSKKQRRVGS